ncbi:hypothetical protein [Thermospira aquatica]|uniref:Lipoprotein n=1 Tax=Thermospira aquatica TaxID=2828656 RepID=A0AAX3BDG0_9SPIR|nr:hypothetical protein [Thermospira aquatica]URA10253.1 hypothetical protein KDW03_00140 [Thermospira aquatica]URA10928.1 hypothetical protein KDW03_03755 [Thermospira aquatica]
MKRCIAWVSMVLFVLVTMGCKESLTRETFLKQEAGGPWGYLYGTRELIRENTSFNLMMNLQIVPLSENGEKPFSIGATSSTKGYYFYRVKPGTYAIDEWGVSGGDSGARSFPVGYEFEVKENTITYLGYVRFHQSGYTKDDSYWITYDIVSTDTMKEDLDMLYRDIPEAKDLKVVNAAWKFKLED